VADDHHAAVALAEEAGQVLLGLRGRLDEPGTDPKALRDEADRASHEVLAAGLAERYPDDAVLSEEGADDATRSERGRVWIVDPLDGTREYAEPGRTDWAVHVALTQDGVLLAGAVALPALDLTLSTGTPPAMAPWGARRPRLAVSRTRPPAVTEALRGALGGELVAMGSAGAKVMAVVRGEAEVYAHAGGQYEWDSAAPAAVAAAAGLHTSRLDGSPLVYNRPDPWLPDLLVCRPELAEQVIATARDVAVDELAGE
jgi:3'(2'), 5'-bisphosphate nucleotidase